MTYRTYRLQIAESSADPDFNQQRPVAFYQAYFKEYLLPYLVRLQATLNNEIGNIKIQSTRSKVKIPFYINGKVYKLMKAKAIIYSKDSGLSRVKGRRIYMDSTLTSASGIAFLSKVLGVNQANIVRVDRNTIRNAFLNKEDVLVFDYISLIDVNRFGKPYTICDTRGVKFIDIIFPISNRGGMDLISFSPN